MTFISEVDYNGSVIGNEFVEITVSLDEDLSDILVAVYQTNGSLLADAGIPDGTNDLQTLIDSDEATVVDRPGNPLFEVVAFGWANSTTDAFEFIATQNQGPVTANTGQGPFANQSTTSEVPDRIQYDRFGNTVQTGLPIYFGDSVICFTEGIKIMTAANVEAPIEQLKDFADGRI